MFGSRASKDILKPYLERLAGAYYLAGPRKEAFIEQTLALIANEPEAFTEAPVEKALAEAMARVYHANSHEHHQSGSTIHRADFSARV
jgi:hypothetical protein